MEAADVKQLLDVLQAQSVELADLRRSADAQSEPQIDGELHQTLLRRVDELEREVAMRPSAEDHERLKRELNLLRAQRGIRPSRDAMLSAERRPLHRASTADAVRRDRELHGLTVERLRERIGAGSGFDLEGAGDEELAALGVCWEVVAHCCSVAGASSATELLDVVGRGAEAAARLAAVGSTVRGIIEEAQSARQEIDRLGSRTEPLIVEHDFTDAAGFPQKLRELDHVRRWLRAMYRRHAALLRSSSLKERAVHEVLLFAMDVTDSETIADLSPRLGKLSQEMREKSRFIDRVRSTLGVGDEPDFTTADLEELLNKYLSRMGFAG